MLLLRLLLLATDIFCPALVIYGRSTHLATSLRPSYSIKASTAIAASDLQYTNYSIHYWRLWFFAHCTRESSSRDFSLTADKLLTFAVSFSFFCIWDVTWSVKWSVSREPHHMKQLQNTSETDVLDVANPLCTMVSDLTTSGFHHNKSYIISES